MQRWTWLVFVGVMPLVAGCASNSLSTQTADSQTQAQAESSVSSQEPSADKEPSANGEPSANKQSSKAHQTPPAKSQLPNAELSAELLYLLSSGEIAGQQGDLSFATQQYLAAAKESRDPRIARRATRISAYAQEDESTVEAATLWDELDPENVEIKQILAAVWLKQGNAEKARPYLKDVLRLSNSPRDAYKRLEALLAQLPEGDTLDQVLTELTEGQQDDAEVQFLFAKLALRRKHYEQAEKYIDAVLEHQPERLDALMIKAELLKRREAYDESLELLAQAVELMPTNSKLRLEYVRSLFAQRHDDKAVRALTELVDDFAERDEIVLSGAILAMEANHLELAKKWFLPLAQESNRHQATAMFFLGQIASFEDNDEKAIYWFSKVTNGRYQLEAKLRLAISLVKLERYEEALEQLEYLHIEDEEQLVKVVQVRAEIQRELKQYQAAYDTYTAALNEFPNNPELLYARAMSAERLDRMDLLEQDLRKILENDPEDSQTLNALGYTLADKTDRYPEALELISRALLLNPGDIATQDSMGWVLYRMQRYDEAVTYLQKAYDESKDGEIAAHLGEVLWVMGNKELAQNIWQKALEKDPEHEVLLETIQRFIPELTPVTSQEQ